ncbi:MAG: sulfotransferase family 2 domain-containing protein [Acidimicrobiales bacterium]|jgi:hypothetical protein
MIISHQLQLIFVKTRKTAGTSIEIALSQFAGPDDVITAITEDDEALRRQVGGRGPQNDRVPLGMIGRQQLSTLVRQRKWPTFKNHTPASRIREKVGAATWDRYTTFTVVRNPWDRAVSLYYFVKGTEADAPPTFSAFLAATPAIKLSNFHLYAIDGRVAVDRVVRYEDLLDGLAEVWKEVGITDEVVLPHAKGAFRPTATRDYRSQMTDGDAEYIARVCRTEIEAFDYAFD